MHCQACRQEVPETRHVTFYQNIGLLILRFPSSVQGHFCKGCIHHYFWKMTLISLVAGWWGVISLITNCFFVINNIAQYVPCWLMQSAQAQPHQPPPLTESFRAPALERMQKHHQDIIVSLEAGEPRKHLCERIADRAMVPATEVERYIQVHVDSMASGNR